MKIKITAQPGTTRKNKTGGWRTFKPKTDLVKCTSCGICVIVCPEGCIEMSARGGSASGGKKMIPVTDYNYCKGCAVCATECPVHAITMKLDKK